MDIPHRPWNEEGSEKRKPLNVVPMRVRQQDVLILERAHLDEFLAKVVRARAEIKHHASAIFRLNLTAGCVATVPHNIGMAPSDRAATTPYVDFHCSFYNVWGTIGEFCRDEVRMGLMLFAL